MTKTCRKCNNEIPQLDLSEPSRLELWGLIYQGLKLFAVKKIMDDQKVAHKEAKIIVDHLNRKYGRCGRCDYEDLDIQNIDCPKCGAFNYNIKEPIFNQDFCSLLEYSLPFDQLEDKNVRNFWCDGIDPVPFDIKNLALENIRKVRKITTRAWTGVSGQDIYEMTIHFGEKSINCFEKELSLKECIYSNNADNWINLNPNSKTIEIRLK